MTDCAHCVFIFKFVALNGHHGPDLTHFFDWHVLVHEHVWLYGQHGDLDGAELVRWPAH